MQFDWVTFVLEIVNFLILVWILKRFLYQPVLKTIARRKAAIDRTLADARTKTTDAEALERQYRDRLGDWEKEKQSLRSQLEEEINATRARRTAALDEELKQEREKRRLVEERKMNEWRARTEEEAVIQGTQFAAKLLS
ncbi:MAG: F0F1 ATP synthase subunit B family protein, partial [Burkholderiales bacterium]